jgi:predicted nucleic acid-binding protein
VKILLDTNIILDVALEREPYCLAAAKMPEASDFDRIHLFISASMATDVFYVVRKETGSDVGLAFVKDLLDAVDVGKVDEQILLLALQSDSRDFEDAVQYFAAMSSDVELIVTRNKEGFADATLKVLAPEEFLAEYLPTS